MDSTTPDCEAFDETIVFLSFFKDLHDTTRENVVGFNYLSLAPSRPSFVRATNPGKILIIDDSDVLTA
jgi:hypothetical protein